MMPAAGPVFWILTVLAAVAVFTYFERLVDLRRAQIDYQDFLKGVANVLDAGNVDEALVICEDTPAPVAQIVATAIRHRDGSARLLREAVEQYYTQVVLAYRDGRAAKTRYDDDARAAFSRAAFRLADDYEGGGDDNAAVHVLELVADSDIHAAEEARRRIAKITSKGRFL